VRLVHVQCDAEGRVNVGHPGGRAVSEHGCAGARIDLRRDEVLPQAEG
jgi:hypothetical protein